MGLRKGYYMDGKVITKFIEKFNLPHEFVITNYMEHGFISSADVLPIESFESGFYPVYCKSIDVDMYYCDGEVCELLKRFDGLIFSYGDIFLCDLTHDGFQPIVTIEGVYDCFAGNPIERIF